MMHSCCDTNTLIKPFICKLAALLLKDCMVLLCKVVFAFIFKRLYYKMTYVHKDSIVSVKLSNFTSKEMFISYSLFPGQTELCLLNRQVIYWSTYGMQHTVQNIATRGMHVAVMQIPHGYLTFLTSCLFRDVTIAFSLVLLMLLQICEYGPSFSQQNLLTVCLFHFLNVKWCLVKDFHQDNHLLSLSDL